MALFQEKESRDELGLGGIRDAFADRLFPGTSTIQTRLRYMLFVPWIYRALEQQRVGPGEFARRADGIERDLIDTMRNADEREAGVFGGRSGRQLKRLPSSVYWAGLGSWGIRVADLSQDQYHRGIGVVYRRRAEQADRDKERTRNGDDSERTPEAGTVTWHPRLPPAPPDFPGAADFNLTAEEAGFLLDRMKRSHPDSLLAHLALHCEPADVGAPWHHPDLASFSDSHRELAAALYDLAARIERATPANERWVVEVERRGDTVGRVVLEMIEGDEREVVVAMEVLRTVVGGGGEMPNKPKPVGGGVVV